MNKLLLTLTISLGIASTAMANLDGNGFYRVKNYGSDRWATLVDNYASVDFFAASADLHSLVLTNNTEDIISDPGSVVYITRKANNQYDVAGQGVSLESLVNNNISIQQSGTASDGQDLYLIYGVAKGATKYIGDANIMTYQEYGKASLNVANPNFNKWYFIPLNADSENYFGAIPSIITNQGQYTTLFTSFAYKPYSEGVKAYYIDRVGYGMAEMVEITDAVPPGSPVVIKCVGPKAANNKMQILEQQNTLPNNSLTGVYFNYSGDTNVNRVKYDPETMRILGVCKDGSIGFITGNIDFIPANTAYLKVPSGSSPELKCVSPQEYEQGLPVAPESFYLNEAAYALYPQGDDNYTGTFDIPAPTGENKDINIRFYPSSATSANQNYIGPFSADVTVVNGYSNHPFQYNSPYYWVLSAWKGGTLQVTLNLQYQYAKFYSEMSGIDMIIAPEGNIVFDGKEVYANGAHSITVFNIAGQKMASADADRLNIANLPKGTYVVVADGKSLKIKL